MTARLLRLSRFRGLPAVLVSLGMMTAAIGSTGVDASNQATPASAAVYGASIRFATSVPN